MKEEEIETKIKKAVKIGAIVLIIGMLALGSFYIVNAGERGILITLGKPSDEAMKEGFHWKAPIIQRVTYMDVQTQKYDAEASAASKDLQVVSTKIAVNYHLTPESVVKLYKEIGKEYSTRVIQPAVQEVVKASTAKFTAEELITKREAVKQLIDEGLKERLINRGIVMETTSITNFDFSAQFNAAIEAKVTAEQNALTEKNRLAQIEYQAKQKVAEANGTATSRILQANAEAEGSLLVAQAEAKGKLLKAETEAKALQLQREQLNDKVLELRRIEVQAELARHWTGQVPTYQMGETGILPVLNMQTTIPAITAK